MEAKTLVVVFSQGPSESLYEARERYKSMLRRCTNHGFYELTQINISLNGLQPQPKLLLDETADGSLMSKSTEDAIYIIDRIVINDHQVQHNRGHSQKKAGIIELGTNYAILAHNKLLTQTVEELRKQMSKLPRKLKEMKEVPNKHQQVS